MIAYGPYRLCKSVVYFPKRLENNKTQLVCQILSTHARTHTHYIVLVHFIYTHICA